MCGRVGPSLSVWGVDQDCALQIDCIIDEVRIVNDVFATCNLVLKWQVHVRINIDSDEPIGKYRGSIGYPSAMFMVGYPIIEPGLQVFLRPPSSLDQDGWSRTQIRSVFIYSLLIWDHTDLNIDGYIHIPSTSSGIVGRNHRSLSGRPSCVELLCFSQQSVVGLRQTSHFSSDIGTTSSSDPRSLVQI